MNGLSLQTALGLGPVAYGMHSYVTILVCTQSLLWVTELWWTNWGSEFHRWVLSCQPVLSLLLIAYIYKLIIHHHQGCMYTGIHFQHSTKYCFAKYQGILISIYIKRYAFRKFAKLKIPLNRPYYRKIQEKLVLTAVELVNLEGTL